MTKNNASTLGLEYGNSGTTGVLNALRRQLEQRGLKFANSVVYARAMIRRQAALYINGLSPAGLFSPATGAKQAARNQERYRTAGRVLPRSPRGECTCVLDPSGASHQTLPLACRANSPATGAKQAARNQERYRTAGRVLPRSPRGECTCVLDPSDDDRKARPGKARSLRALKI